MVKLITCDKCEQGKHTECEERSDTQDDGEMRFGGWLCLCCGKLPEEYQEWKEELDNFDKQ